MKYALILFLFMLASWSTAQSLSDIRSSFHRVVLDPDDSEVFYEYIQNIEQTNATIMAYQAISEAMLAQVMWNPFNKLSQVKKYDRLMDEAINQDPDNIEIRFLRLATEYNLPSFLGMSDHIEEDVEILTSNLSDIAQMNLNPDFGKYIFHFLEETNLCSSHQIYQMRQMLNQHATTVMAGSE